VFNEVIGFFSLPNPSFTMALGLIQPVTEVSTRNPRNPPMSGQSRIHVTTDNQSASPPWCQVPIWDPRPILSPQDFL
jgi:hypothetical protein